MNRFKKEYIASIQKAQDSQQSLVALFVFNVTVSNCKLYTCSYLFAEEHCEDITNTLMKPLASESCQKFLTLKMGNGTQTLETMLVMLGLPFEVSDLDHSTTNPIVVNALFGESKTLSIILLASVLLSPGRVGISLIGVTLPLLHACCTPGPEFLSAYFVVFFCVVVFSMV